MARTKQPGLSAARQTKLGDAMEILRSLGFAARQSNEVAGYTLLALLDLKPLQSWSEASEPLRGITPIIDFVAQEYGVRYAPNTRETIRDEAVKHFVEAGMVIRNPDNPNRPTNSGKTVYQTEPNALELIRAFGTIEWSGRLKSYLAVRDGIRNELLRERKLTRIPVKLPSGQTVSISPGGQNPLIKNVVEEFCTRFMAGGTVLYIGDAEDKFLHLDAEYLKRLGVEIPASAKMPDLVVHDTRRNWLVLIEVVTSAGPVDGKRRKELKDRFAGCTAGLVFVSAFSTREIMRSFLTQISWETEVWVAQDPEHLIHFNGERFLGPYPDVMP
ncbi:MAG: BsuBI/PstI family type II restriction endonuclease [Verrucomicrobiota bacterium]